MGLSAGQGEELKCNEHITLSFQYKLRLDIFLEPGEVGKPLDIKT